MSIYVTGDVHHNIDIKKLNTSNFPEQKEMTKDDYVIVAGDFGLIWDNSKEDLYWRNWLHEKNFTTLFVDGNHENFDLLEIFPIIDRFGGRVRKINDSIYQLMRGEVYTVNGKKIFTMGGAESVDKENRIEFISWWKQELPNFMEYENALTNLKKHNYEVDYIITHTCPEGFMEFLSYGNPKVITNNNLEVFLQTIYENIKFRHWYFGHWHQDVQITGKATVIYSEIVKLGWELK